MFSQTDLLALIAIFTGIIALVDLIQAIRR